MADWDARQYERFARERTQAVHDLMARISGLSPHSVLDIGSGPGNSTAVLREAFPKAAILGIDSSDNMLSRARSAHPDLEFRKCEVPDDLVCLSGGYDLVFSNACLHWIPGQERVLRSILAVMAKGGTLAVQMPIVQQAPFYQVLGKLVAASRWQDELAGIKNFHNLAPGEYYDLLSSLGTSFDIWETAYYHRMSSVAQILEWYRGSGLRPYLAALDGEERLEFERELLERMEGAYPAQADGSVILKMPRLFFVAQKW